MNSYSLGDVAAASTSEPALFSSMRSPPIDALRLSQFAITPPKHGELLSQGQLLMAILRRHYRSAGLVRRGPGDQPAHAATRPARDRWPPGAFAHRPTHLAVPALPPASGHRLLVRLQLSTPRFAFS